MTTTMDEGFSPLTNDLQFSFEALANPNVSVHQDSQNVNGGWQSNSPFDTPPSMHQSNANNKPFQRMNLAYDDSQYPDLHGTQVAGLGIDFTGLSTPEPAFYQSGREYFPAQQHGDIEPSTGIENGLHSNMSGILRRTRSGRPIARSFSPSQDVLKGDMNTSRVGKSSRSRRAKAGKGAASRTPKLDAPLSVLTENMNVPVRDMEAWVKRPAEVRQREAEKRNGYITRPMNSFMLYRSAYAERTKMWCLQNNHQIVSSVSGESWPMESEEIREHYNELARIERDNHQKAHPAYKFSPSKPSSGSRRKKDSSSSDEGEPSDFDDPDWEWKPRKERRSGKGKKKEKAGTYPYQLMGGLSISRSTPKIGFKDSEWSLSQQGQYHRNPQTVMISDPNFQSQYLQHNMNDLVQTPESFSMMTPEYQHMFDAAMPSGAPGSHHSGSTRFKSPSYFAQSRVDPSLVQFGDEYGYGGRDDDSFRMNNGTPFEEEGHLFGNASQSEIPSQFEELMEDTHDGP